MATLFKPHSRGLTWLGASRPILDRTHPLTRNLGFCLVLNDNVVTDLAGPSFDDFIGAAGAIQHPPTVIATKNKIVPTPYGLGMQWPGTPGVGGNDRTAGLDFGTYQPIVHTYAPIDQCTILAIANPQPVTFTQTTFYSQRTQGGSQIDLIFNSNQATSVVAGQWALFTSQGGTCTATSAWVDGNFHVFVSRIDNGNNIQLWQDGISLGVSGSGVGGATFADSTQKLCVGGLGDYAGNEYAPDGTICVCVYAWNRALTDDEIRQVSLDPYCFLQAAETDLPTAYITPNTLAGQIWM